MLRLPIVLQWKPFPWFGRRRGPRGRPARGAAGEVGLTQADEERIRAVRRAELGSDAPVPERYVRWLGRMVRGDRGVSYLTGQPVLAMAVSGGNPPDDQA